MGRWSVEEHLLGYDKYSSNMYSNNQGNLLGNSSDEDVHHKCLRAMRAQKYLIATTALNAMQLLFWPHLCGEDP